MAELNLADLRQEYRKAALDIEDLGTGPIAFFGQWFNEAQQSGIDDVNAMTLATTDKEGRPHARIVLLKGLDTNNFQFFTNYESDKAAQLEARPYAALLFFWKELERQVRVEGRVEKLPEAASDAYFASRPVGSQLGAWASPQSRPVANRAVLEARFVEAQGRFASKVVPRPEHWGGYAVIPERIEFWQGRPSRLHDRILFERAANGWSVTRLAP